MILAGSILLYKMERRREIAVIRCLSGDTRTLLFQYLAESGLTGLLAAPTRYRYRPLGDLGADDKVAFGGTTDLMGCSPLGSGRRG